MGKNTPPNPYEPPRAYGQLPDGLQPIASPSWGYAIGRGFVLVGWYIVLSAVIGGATSTVLDWVAPEYYLSIFGGTSLGRGTDCLLLGVVQGIVFGVAIGLIVAVGLGWFRQLQTVTCLRSFAIVICVAVTFAICGGLLGWTLGLTSPDYYRRVVVGGHDPRFNPVDVGLGLGTSEGLMLGGIIGAWAVVWLAWRRSKLKRF